MGVRAGCLYSSRSGLLIAAASGLIGCTAPPSATAPPSQVVLNLSCEAAEAALVCGASTSPTAASETPGPVDVTPEVKWSSSDERIASVRSGRVVGRTAGTVTITATLSAAAARGQASILVIVADAALSPQVAYEIEGAVRDSLNSGIADVDVTLLDDHGRQQRVKTARTLDGLFRFAPVVAGHYQIRAFRHDYRPAEREITVPDSRPLTLMLLADPRALTQSADASPDRP